ncbi:MAG: hypothetical protein IKP05_02010 [Alphaproteobacteria bacterium]|nr:hypothetical protein [Alphaproteobacteria bacterium]
MARWFDNLRCNKRRLGYAAMRRMLPAKSKYNFVETYTVVDPKNLLINYAMFSACDMVPVVCEGYQSVGSYTAALRLPRDVVWGFLNDLTKLPAEITDEPENRTISIIHLTKDQRIVVMPDFNTIKGAVIWAIDNEKNGGPSWVCDITPEKNRAIVEQVKIHTR